MLMPLTMELTSFIMFADVSKISAQENTSPVVALIAQIVIQRCKFQLSNYYIYTFIIYYTYIFLLQIFPDTHC